MADDQHRAVPLAQGALQPLDGFQVKVIGGLVQHQQVGLFQQQARQQGARLLPAGKVRQRHLPGILAQPQPLQGLLDVQFICIAAGGFEGGLQFAVLLEQLVAEIGRHSRFEVVQALLLVEQVAEDGQHLGVDGVFARGECVHSFLAQVAQARTARHAHLPGGGGVNARQQQQQRGFANAVGPDQTDFAVAGDVERDAAEQIEGAEREAEVFCGEDGHAV